MLMAPSINFTYIYHLQIHRMWLKCIYQSQCIIHLFCFKKHCIIQHYHLKMTFSFTICHSFIYVFARRQKVKSHSTQSIFSWDIQIVYLIVTTAQSIYCSFMRYDNNIWLEICEQIVMEGCLFSVLCNSELLYWNKNE